jgi:hypothetical protein
MYNVNSLSGNLKLNILPDECPFCHNSITPNLIVGYTHDGESEVFMSCPDSKCKKSFIGYYFYIGNSEYEYSERTTFGRRLGKKFSESITETSLSFTVIYNEAFSAEQENLSEICGVGYRKALEFLIKDYVILKNEQEKDKILKMQLGNCIKAYIKDERIKSVSKRAVWLGNDETHYVRKWETKNLQDLKKLIELTVHWIEMEKLTESFENEMPE